MTPQMQMLVAILGGGTTVGVVFSFIQFLMTRHDRKKCNDDEMRKNVLGMKEQLQKFIEEIDELKEDDLTLLHDRIYQAYNYTKNCESISVIGRANIDYLFARYNKRGGNHKAHLMYEQIKNIQVVNDDE